MVARCNCKSLVYDSRKGAWDGLLQFSAVAKLTE